MREFDQDDHFDGPEPDYNDWEDPPNGNDRWWEKHDF
jgi:hypothetical protein